MDDKKQTLLDNQLIRLQKEGSSDIFQTPPEAVDCLLPFLKPNLLIWESACGFYLLAKYLSEHGHTVLSTDIMYGQDFFEFEPETYDVQVTNPPYSIKDDWLERSFDLGKPFALLLPVNVLHSVRRCKMFKEFGIQVIIPPRRINFITPSGNGKGAWFPVLWLTHGLELENDLIYA